MVQITLTTEEAALLRHVLDRYMSDLRADAAAADGPLSREQLAQQEQMLKRMFATLSGRDASWGELERELR